MLTYNKRQWVDLDDGERVEIRPAGLTISQKFGAEDGGVLDLLELCVTSWTYTEPLTREMLGELDPASAGKIIDAINEFSGTKRSKND